ncbi:MULTISPECIES: helicase-exonuclease AddAB subunit AddA [unclassified Ruminococcus]|uniref:helicase-exonuclease AddAB subunit AddA n=1 Tax=unclassified Ruminococcus TaxID=2608920 RepID=UPI00210A6D75|nr:MULTISPECIES: helicase-exonuclease AddAB subunit AddA [unclassified Ruminococcus]MCQ4022660.1 helicase-exonuclease AddAB subunit AddA [Ruminococcus sp. zg-924]MCQ4114900.1 helicase-exonuclease AddAB subunit AddA [Ruminococcus sp. zg-921]
MAREWTPAQKDAIYAKGGAVIVSAAAGSGKTAVLVERVISRITDPENKIDIDKLLIVTYTKAAAAEMRERISAQLELLSKKFPSEAYYRRQLMLLPKANISTIHSFCGNVIKENFYLLEDIPSDYKIGDESVLAVIKNQAVENVIERLYDSEDEGFRYMADCFSTAKGEYNLKSTVLDIYEFLCSQPFPDKWMSDVEADYSIDSVSQSIWGRAILGEARLAAEFLTDKANECLSLFERYPEIGAGFGEVLESEYKALADEFFCLVKAEDWDGLYKFSSTEHKFSRLSAAKGYAKNPTKIKIANICAMIKKELTNNIPKLFICSSEQYSTATAIVRPAISALFKTVKLFTEEYARLKKEESLADFSDLEHWTVRLLYNNGQITDLARKLSDSYDEVMVDEYQDANEVQDLIFTSVSDNGRKLFVVGDVKQSIYRFRQANPELFLRRKNNYQPYDRELDNYPAKIVLDKNFRSRSGITENVNFIFSKLMSPQAGDMYYLNEDKLVCGATYSEDNTPDCTLDMLFTPNKLEVTAYMAEARLISNRIIQMKQDFKVEENGVKREARYSDFAILLRNNTHALDYLSVLNAGGIPAQCSSSDNFLDTVEISIIISLLKVISNPLQDVPLLNVMTSPIFAFTPTELAKIRAENRREPLYASVSKFAANGDKHCKELCDALKSFRNHSTTCSLSELLEEIYSKTAYLLLVSSTEGGQLKLNNLRLFQQYTADYDESGGSLSSYIRYLDKLIEQSVELKAAKADSEISRVRIMTIHSSKGLEFPVCFVAGISSQKHYDASQLLMHPKLGVGAAVNYIDGPYKLETVQKQAVKMQQDIDEISEELRVLYVALTRAKEKLFMLASFRSGDVKKTLNELYSKLDCENGKIHPYVVRNFSTAAQRLAACAILYGANSNLSDILEQPCKPFDGKTEDFWKTEIYMGNEIAEQFLEIEEKPDNNINISFEEIKRRLSLEYNNNALTKIPVKVSVSDIAHKDDSRTHSFSARPAFLADEKMTAAQKGTAIHTLMQFADYKAFSENPQAEIERLVSKRFITQAQADIVDTQKVLNCLNTPIMQSFLYGDETFREYRFTVKIKAKDIFDDNELSDNDELILQGAVDCAFVENGRLVIIDYKTDRVKNMNELKSKYAEQLRLYSYAMKLSTGFEVSRCVIYSFELNDIIEV